MNNLALCFELKYANFFAKNIFIIITSVPGANPTTSEFTTTTAALQKARAFFQRKSNFYLFRRCYVCTVPNLYNNYVHLVCMYT
jgi:hypothetical protein